MRLLGAYTHMFQQDTLIDMYAYAYGVQFTQYSYSNLFAIIWNNVHTVAALTCRRMRI